MTNPIANHELLNPYLDFEGNGLAVSPARVQLGQKVTLTATAASAQTGVVKVWETSTGAWSNTTAVIPTDDTIPQSNEGTEILSLRIDPTGENHTFYASATITGTTSTLAQFMATVCSSTQSNALAATWQQVDGAGVTVNLSLTGSIVRSSNSSFTLSLRYGTSAGTAYVNGTNSAGFFGGIMCTSLRVLEVA